MAGWRRGGRTRLHARRRGTQATVLRLGLGAGLHFFCLETMKAALETEQPDGSKVRLLRCLPLVTRHCRPTGRSLFSTAPKRPGGPCCGRAFACPGLGPALPRHGGQDPHGERGRAAGRLQERLSGAGNDREDRGPQGPVPRTRADRAGHRPLLRLLLPLLHEARAERSPLCPCRLAVPPMVGAARRRICCLLVLTPTGSRRACLRRTGVRRWSTRHRAPWQAWPPPP